MTSKIIFINLKRRVDRREKMVHLIKTHKFAACFYDAIDGKELKQNDARLSLFKNNDFKNNRAVIGCALSHYNLWNMLINDTKYNCYTIFEDDITLCVDFTRKYNKMLASLPQNFDIIYLGFGVNSKYRDRDQCDANTQSITTKMEYSHFMGGAFAYVISTQGAQKLIAHLTMNGITRAIDYVQFAMPLNIYELKPHIVYSKFAQADGNLDSDIQYETISL